MSVFKKAAIVSFALSFAVLSGAMAASNTNPASNGATKAAPPKAEIIIRKVPG